MNESGEEEEIREGDLRERGRERCTLDPLPIVAGAQAVLLLLPLLHTSRNTLIHDVLLVTMQNFVTE
jgi:hypothetical protein